MSATVDITVNGKRLSVDPDISLAAALLNAGVISFRTSVNQEARAPLCGMGICFECRVRVGENHHVRSCLARIEAGMEVETAR